MIGTYQLSLYVVTADPLLITRQFITLPRRRGCVAAAGAGGQPIALQAIARDIARRMIDIFLLDKNQRRPVYGGAPKFSDDPHWRDHLLFYEYFHGDNGAGIGASHQTGWTALVANLIDEWR